MTLGVLSNFPVSASQEIGEKPSSLNWVSKVPIVSRSWLISCCFSRFLWLVSHSELTSLSWVSILSIFSRKLRTICCFSLFLFLISLIIFSQRIFAWFSSFFCFSSRDRDCSSRAALFFVSCSYSVVSLVIGCLISSLENSLSSNHERP